ncbi:DNA-directed RNA polymerase sigma-70 factor [Adhaeribacter aerolatus]|uniref:DNA-directed RNA polymerase sigma-70 factor n=1 Tax=Adhaeribacter aerolatus TaxID=670289 RepID=A0A512AZ87_9BACT|nr:sigma-70 family RNA polymerase sigma factor [Adhaeribacter aerolatus]GEO05006.1 DNA-directed RNA polymerase sigma-70 factor [Adhaeribacter aerolatus]
MSRHENIAFSEEDLIQRLQQREDAALTLLYERYSAALYGVILRIVKTEEVAEDVMQETFVKIWFSIGQYNKEKGRLFTWLVNIARHAAIDKIRSKEFRVGLKNKPIQDSPVNQLHSSYEVRPEHIGIKDMVGKLNPDQKKIIDMMYFDGYTQSEVAEELDIPLGTVKTRARAAIKFLTKLLS